MYIHNNIKYFLYDLWCFFTVNIHSHIHAYPSIDKYFVCCYIKSHKSEWTPLMFVCNE